MPNAHVTARIDLRRMHSVDGHVILKRAIMMVVHVYKIGFYRLKGIQIAYQLKKVNYSLTIGNCQLKGPFLF